MQFVTSKIGILPLKALSLVYDQFSRFRNYLFDRKCLPTYTSTLPVICVGNLSAGGNAKTPLVNYLALSLLDVGYRPVVLTRGYGGKEKGPYLVKPDDLTPLVSDEALLQAKLQKFPVLVAQNRVAGAKYIEQKKLGNIILMDDGFQHRWLTRNVDILAVNLTTIDDLENFLAGELLPLGRFRENLSAGLQRAHFIVFINRSLDKLADLPKKLLSVLPEHLKIFRAQLKLCAELNLPEKANQKIVAFCAIANPEGFFKSLEQLGYKLCARISFPDHHNYTWEEIKELQAKYPEIPLVCTSKDIVKLDPSWGKFYALNTELEIQHRDAFVTQVIKAL